MDVALIDEHHVVRTGLLVWLATELPHVRVTGSFASPIDYLMGQRPTASFGAVVTEIQEGDRALDMECLRRLGEIGPSVVNLQQIRAKYAHVARPASTKSALPAKAIEEGIVGPSDVRANGRSIRQTVGAY